MRYVVATSGSNLNVRSGAGTTFPVIQSIEPGTTVEVQNTTQGWARLQGGGYASLQFLRPAHANSPEPAPETQPAGNSVLQGLDWDTLWSNYPTEDKDTVKHDIGGAVDATWITNTCTIRISRALNAAGTLVPGNVSGLSTVRGADGNRYAFRVREMQAYFQSRFGQPTARMRNTAARETLAGRRGIVVFNFDSNHGDATGHIDLWDGESIRYNDVLGTPGTVSFWEIP